MCRMFQHEIGLIFFKKKMRIFQDLFYHIQTVNEMRLTHCHLTNLIRIFTCDVDRNLFFIYIFKACHSLKEFKSSAAFHSRDKLRQSYDEK